MFIEKMTDKEIEELIEEMKKELKKEKCNIEIDINSDITISDFKIFFNSHALPKQEKFILNKVFRKCMKKKFGQKYVRALKDYKEYKQNNFEEDLTK